MNENQKTKQQLIEELDALRAEKAKTDEELIRLQGQMNLLEPEEGTEWGNLQNKDELYLLFRNSRYFRHVSDEALAKFLALMTYQHFKKGTTIIAQKQENDAIYILLKGTVSVEVNGKLIHNLARKGDIFGEMSVISGKLSVATNKAIEEVKVAVISSKTLAELTDNIDHELNSIFYKWFSQIFASKLDFTTQKASLYEAEVRQFREDLESARTVQQEILATYLTPIPNLSLSIKCEFADLLGGDFYGTFSISNDLYGILIGDVAEHGAKPSLLAVAILSYFAHFSKACISPQQVLSQVNELCQALIPQNSFATVFYAVYHTTTNQLIYAYGGNPPAVILRENKVLTLPRGKGFPLGMFDKQHSMYEEKFFQMESGDRLVIFTDALYECFSKDKKMLGMEKLFELFEQNASLPPKAFADEIYNYGYQFTGGNLHDDFTLMVFDQAEALSQRDSRD